MPQKLPANLARWRTHLPLGEQSVALWSVHRGVAASPLPCSQGEMSGHVCLSVGPAADLKVPHTRRCWIAHTHGRSSTPDVYRGGNQRHL